MPELIQERNFSWTQELAFMFNNFTEKLNTLLKPLVEGLSFDTEVRKLVDILNQRIEHYQEVSIHIASHPGGFTREIHKRRLSIAEAYIKIVRALDSEQYEERLKALQALVHQSLHAKTVSLPLNTARVQVALMKEAVKSVDNRRRQLELVSDFTLASFGQESVIRRLLRELNLIQVPESGKPLSQLNMGWDSHVHDNLSEGRKTPSQVLLDAFVKGISEVTLAYYDFFDPRIITEAIGAGEILGITVRLGIEFSVGQKNSRRHFMFIPSGCRSAQDYNSFYQSQRETLAGFWDNLKRNAHNRRVTIEAMLENFNSTHLKEINQGFEDIKFLHLTPLSWEGLHSFIPQGQATRMHLGELLYHELKPVLFKRTLWLLNQYHIAQKQYKNKELTQWEFKIISQQYEKVRQQYQTLTPEQLRANYFYDPAIMDYDSAFATELDILPLLQPLGEVVYIHPLEAGLQAAVHTLITYAPYISEVETFNNRDSVKRDPTDMRILNTFVYDINNRGLDELREEIAGWRIESLPDELLAKAWQHYHARPLLPRCGSDSTGRDPEIPGMGFISLDRLKVVEARYFSKTHTLLPEPISNMVQSQGKEEKGQKYAPIVSLGKIGMGKKNLVGDEKPVSGISLKRFWRYLNPTLKGWVKILAGFIPAYLTFKGNPSMAYAFIWFGITFTRNALVDVIATTGKDIRDWSWRGVNFDNLTSSLFWTGFSVPILSLVKYGFDVVYPPSMLAGGVLFRDLLKFFFICFANGAYISFHNRLRGFDKAVIRGNFFRSVLSWPFATVFAPLGDLVAIPSIVQAKFWSDFVAGLIEGSGKYVQRMTLRKRDLREIMPQLHSLNPAHQTVAMLDILYIWSKSQRGDTMLTQILTGRETSLLSGLKHKLKEKSSLKEILAFLTRREGIYPLEDIKFFNNYRKLRELFYEEGAVKRLNYLVLENYSGKEAYKLINLIALYFNEFKEWLLRIQPAVEAAAARRSTGQ